MKMDDAYIEQHNVAERYVLGQLEPDELDSFEERLLWSEEARREVELIERLRAGTRAVVADGYPIYAAPANPEGMRIPRLPTLAAAASILVAATLGLMFIGQPASQPGATTSAYELSQVRSPNATLAVIDPPANEQWVSLITYPEFDDHATFQVTVEKAAAANGWHPIFTSPASPGLRDRLIVMLPRDLLQPGVHRLRLDGVRGNASSQVLSIRFRVAIPDE